MSINTYQLLEGGSKQNLKYFFISSGKDVIVKTIEYSFVSLLGERKIFNLAFGDYNIHDDKIDDSIDSNNGDGRKVLRTVLGTVPKFFDVCPNDIIMVTGSDTKEEYLKRCLTDCQKNCDVVDNCRNKGRRISVYNNHVSINFDELSKTYTFFGGLNSEGVLQIVPYELNNKYDAMFVIKK